MEELKNYYDIAASTFELAYSSNGITNGKLKADMLLDISKFTSLLVGLQYTSLLDLGCGTGYWMNFYYKDDIHLITGVDISDRMGTIFLEHGRGKKIIFISSEILNYLSTCTKKYDAIIVSFVLSHYSDKSVVALLLEVKNCLSSGGRVLIQDSSWSLLREQETPKLIVKKNSKGEVLKIYRSTEEIVSIIKTAGFSIIYGNYGKAFFHYLVTVDATSSS